MKLQKLRRMMASVASLIVAAASFALSFVALRDVAASSGAVPGYLAWLVPIVIDGGVICGSAIIWSESHENARRPVFPFLFVGALVIISVVVNAAHAGPSPLAKLIAALPPLILLGTLELVAAQGRSTRNQVAVTPTSETATAAAASAVTVTTSQPAAAEVVAVESPTTPARTPRPRQTSTRPRTTTAKNTAATPRTTSEPTADAPQSVLPVAEALTSRRPLRVAAEPAELHN